VPMRPGCLPVQTSCQPFNSIRLTDRSRLCTAAIPILHKAN
jgi:hypothetical protein